jgi:hypothetical protein
VLALLAVHNQNLDLRARELCELRGVLVGAKRPLTQTPVVRVAFSIFGFAEEEDHMCDHRVSCALSFGLQTYQVTWSA